MILVHMLWLQHVLVYGFITNDFASSNSFLHTSFDRFWGFRARELFYYLKGGQVDDYGEEYNKACGHSQFGRVYEQGSIFKNTLFLDFDFVILFVVPIDR